jgi:hypothetical protein
MAVDEEGGFPYLYKAIETFESPMTDVLSIVYAGRGRVRYHEIGRSAPERRETFSPDKPPHFSIRILRTSVVVPSGSFEARHPYRPILDDAAVQILTDLVVRLRVRTVMIATNVKDRSTQLGTQEVQIVGRKVATGDDAVDPVPTRRIQMVIQ